MFYSRQYEQVWLDQTSLLCTGISANTGTYPLAIWQCGELIIPRYDTHPSSRRHHLYHKYPRGKGKAVFL